MIAEREVLEEQFRTLEQKYHGKDIPLPPFWGGYLVKPETIEFWQGGPARLHDRFFYQRVDGGGWKIDRLSP